MRTKWLTLHFPLLNEGYFRSKLQLWFWTEFQQFWFFSHSLWNYQFSRSVSDSDLDFENQQSGTIICNITQPLLSRSSVLRRERVGSWHLSLSWDNQRCALCASSGCSRPACQLPACGLLWLKWAERWAKPLNSRKWRVETWHGWSWSVIRNSCCEETFWRNSSPSSRSSLEPGSKVYKMAKQPCKL